MLGDAFTVYRKEILTMRRDRRLTIGVTFTSLILMPALMGVLGRVTGADENTNTPIHVFVNPPNPVVAAVVASDSTLVEVAPGSPAAANSNRIVVISDSTTIHLFSTRTDTRTWDAAQRIARGLEAEKAKIVERRLTAAGLSPDILHPFTVTVTDTSSEQDRGAILLGTLVPYLVIVLLVANSIRAVYIAVGEKEKNTLASLLVSQVPREAIVIGKSFAISTFAVIASLLLVLGMVLFANLGFSLAGDQMGALSFTLAPTQIVQLVVNISGLALLISSVIMVLGTFARTQREAGVYTAPLLFVSIFLAVFSFSNSAFGLAAFAVPILGNALAMKATIVTGTALPGLGVALAVNGLVFASLVWLSVVMYRRETVLFRR